MSRGDYDERPTEDGRTGYAKIRHQLATTETNSHLAAFYRSQESKRAAATAFLDLGLQNGERCLYICYESDPSEIRNRLRAVRVDVEQRIQTGDLELVDSREYYTGSGFDPDEMVGKLEEAAEDTLAAGYEGLRVAGENSWSFELEEAFDKIVEFEAKWDQNCPGIPAKTLCQYDIDRFSESAIIQALRTHQFVIYRNTLCEIPYHVRPEQHQNDGDPDPNIVTVLEQASSLSESRRRVEAHEQRLEVINHIFRHNIRNDMNILLSYLELLDRKELVAQEAQDELATMRETLERFIDTSERARYIEQTLQESSVVTVDLASVLAEVIAELEQEFPNAAFDVDCPESVPVVADENVDVAVEELCQNAVVHAATDTPTVSVEVTAAETPGSVRLAVENEGRPIPAAARRAITEGTQTQLRHNSGLGLWLVKWIVDKSYGELAFDETKDRCRVQVTLPTTRPKDIG